MSQSERIRSPPARRYIPDLVSASTRTSPTRAYDRQEAYVQLAAMGEEPARGTHFPTSCLKSPRFGIQSSLGSPKNRRMRSRGPPDLRPIPEGVCEPIYIPKK